MGAADRGDDPGEGPAVGVEHRQRPEIPLLRRRHVHVDQRPDRVHVRVAVGDHHALRPPGGAAGIVDGQEIGLGDLRLFEMPPNVSLAAVRALGDASAKSRLKQQVMKLDDAKAALRNSKLYKEIEVELGINQTSFAGGSRDVEETSNEYRRVQVLAAKGDKSLNKAVGQLIAECLKEDAPQVDVKSEKTSLPNCDLKPDVCLHLGDLDSYASSQRGGPQTQAFLAKLMAGRTP